jgi:quinol monooxygenase YgiN
MYGGAVVMAVKVVITRRFKQGRTEEALPLLNHLRIGGMRQRGYITGETMISLDDPLKLVVLSTWESQKDWQTWRSDPVRRALEDKMDQMLSEPVTYEVFGFGISGRVR